MPVTRSRPGRRPSHTRRRLVLTVLFVVVAMVLLGALMAWQARVAFRSAQAGNADVAEFRARLLDRDVAGAERALSDAQDETGRARAALGGPWWSAAGGLPAVGDDVRAARRLAVTADDVTRGALPAVMTALSYVDPREIGLRDGRVELDPLRRASGQLARASELLATADADAEAIETAGVTPALRTRVEDTQRLLDQTSRLARNAAIAGQLLPDMLGGEGRRNYLILAQNTAEQRSLGGIPGAMVLLRAEGGRLSLVQQSTAADLGRFEEPVLPLSKAEVALYGRVMGQYAQNVTDSPDFPRAAELATEMWQRRMGGRLDGVASVDPWALQLLLRAVGPVDTEAGRLTGRNAADVLLVDVYRRFADPQQQNDVFAEAARVVFDRVRTFTGDPRALTSALAEGVDQGRIMVWSRRPDEQAVLAGTALARTLQDRTPQDSPEIGVYLHDSTASKMSTYQRVTVTATPKTCGTTTAAKVEVALKSVAPDDRDLPEYVTGGGVSVTRGDVLTQLVVYAPQGWSLTGVEASDGRRDLVTFRHDGLWAGAREFRLSPGQTKKLTVTMGGERLPSNLDVRYTPGTKPANVLLEGSGCS